MLYSLCGQITAQPSYFEHVGQTYCRHCSLGEGPPPVLFLSFCSRCCYAFFPSSSWSSLLSLLSLLHHLPMYLLSCSRLFSFPLSLVLLDCYFPLWWKLISLVVGCFLRIHSSLPERCPIDSSIGLLEAFLSFNSYCSKIGLPCCCHSYRLMGSPHLRTPYWIQTSFWFSFLSFIF